MEQHLEALSPETVAGFFLGEALAVTKRFLRVEVQDSGVSEITGEEFASFTIHNIYSL